MRWLLYLLPALIWHSVGMMCYINWYDLWYNPPIHYTDYASHYASVVSAQHFLAGGQLWGYSPFFHAGTPGWCITWAQCDALRRQART